LKKMPDIRLPAVAGKFYPAKADELKRQIASFIGEEKVAKVDALSCILPHAGYMYSGNVAVKTASRINIKSRIILLGPNHTGRGAAFSIMTKGSWQTPLGRVKIDSELASLLLNNSKVLESDTLAHLYEHSLEVELPILQYFKDDFQIVPIILASDDIEILKVLGKEIADTVQETGKKDSTLILASSDMTHYEPQGVAENKDKQAIRNILDLDEDSLMETIRRLDISMCGYAPVVVTLRASKLLGAKGAQLIKYQTSGDITGDKTAVVGYAGIIIH
jgi:MEMO1 family protein